LTLENRIFANTVSRGTGHTEGNSKMAVPYMKLADGSFMNKDTYDEMFFEIEHSKLVFEWLDARRDYKVCQDVYDKVMNSDIEYSTYVIKAVTDMVIDADDALENACKALKDHYGNGVYYNDLLPVLDDYLNEE
jgi:hypothetical protein